MTFSGSSFAWIRHRAAWIGLAAALSVSALSAAAPLPAADRATVREKLAAFVDQPRFSGALWSVQVKSLDRGEVIFSHHEDRLMSPASNCKLFVGALALERLGGDYRIETPILTTRAPDAKGVVSGDLVIAGRGDPSWGARETKHEFEQVFAPFVAAVERAGIQVITGDVVADATYLRVGPQGEGWAANDLPEDFGAEISAISLEDNFADIRVQPGAAIGEPGSAEILQPLTGLHLDNRTQTVAADGPRRIQVVRVAGESSVQIFGTIPLGGKEEITDVSVPRPAAWFARGLKAALERKGIEVRGGTRALRWPEVAPDWSKAFAVGSVSSPTLRELVKGFMKPSQNLETDLVFLHLGETRRTAKTPASTDSNDLALADLHAFLCENALHADDVIFDEGSGLSRNNLSSAEAIVSLLRYMHAHRESAGFEAALPIAGVDGTLRRRFKGTAAENNLRGKTGSLRWAASLSGLVTTASGEHLVFSFLLNRYAAPAHRSAREELDELVARVMGDDGKK